MTTNPEAGKRERIIEAAARVFLEKGYHPATIDEIAEEAGVGKGTIYSYFESKAALMEEILRSTAHAHLESIRERLSGVNGAIARLHALVEYELAVFEEHREFAQVLTSGDAYGLSPEFRPHVHDTLSEVRDFLADLIRYGQEEGVFRPNLDPYVIASIILGMRVGVVHELLKEGSDRRPDEVYRMGLDTLLDGIRRPPANGGSRTGEQGAE